MRYVGTGTLGRDLNRSYGRGETAVHLLSGKTGRNCPFRRLTGERPLFNRFGHRLRIENVLLGKYAFNARKRFWPKGASTYLAGLGSTVADAWAHLIFFSLLLSFSSGHRLRLAAEQSRLGGRRCCRHLAASESFPASVTGPAAYAASRGGCGASRGDLWRRRLWPMRDGWRAPEELLRQYFSDEDENGGGFAGI